VVKGLGNGKGEGVSFPMTTAISLKMFLSNDAAWLGPLGKEVEQPPSEVQFPNMEE